MVRYPPPVASEPTDGDDLARTATAPISSTVGADPADALGASLGRYRLERELGTARMPPASLRRSSYSRIPRSADPEARSPPAWPGGRIHSSGDSSRAPASPRRRQNDAWLRSSDVTRRLSRRSTSNALA